MGNSRRSGSGHSPRSGYLLSGEHQIVRRTQHPIVLMGGLLRAIGIWVAGYLLLSGPSLFPTEFGDPHGLGVIVPHLHEVALLAVAIGLMILAYSLLRWRSMAIVLTDGRVLRFEGILLGRHRDDLTLDAAEPVDISHGLLDRFFGSTIQVGLSAPMEHLRGAVELRELIREYRNLFLYERIDLAVAERRTSDRSTDQSNDISF